MRVISTIVFAMVLSLNAWGQSGTHIVISEVYGGGGNSGATYKNDFIELYNPTASPVDLSGWSVQYASAAGSSWQVTSLSGSISPYRFYLIQEATGSGGTLDLPTPDATGAIALSATNGKVALVNSTAPFMSTNPVDSCIDFVGFGTANAYEGSSRAPAPSNTSSIERKAQSSSMAADLAAGGSDENHGNGYDSDDNASDFIVQTAQIPNPQNSASPAEPLPDVPLPVTIGNIAASIDAGKVCLNFSTATEIDVAGFNILRATSKTGPFDLASSYTSNAALKATGTATNGGSYTFVDFRVLSGRTYFYRIDAVSTAGRSQQVGGILEVEVTVPKDFAVYQNYPNPFNPSTAIGYQLSAVSRVTLAVYDIMGREIAVLADGVQQAGVHSAVFNASEVASGVYLYKLDAVSSDGHRQTAVKKMILLK